MRNIRGLAAVYQAYCSCLTLNSIFFGQKYDRSQIKKINNIYRNLLVSKNDDDLNKAIINVDSLKAYIQQTMNALDNKAIKEGIDTGFVTFRWSLGLLGTELVNTPEIFQIPHVPFGHKEKGYKDFAAEYKKNYPSQLISHAALINDMKKKFEQANKENILKLKESLKKSKEKKKEKEQEKKESSDKAVDLMEDQELAKKCYFHTVELPDASWDARAKLFEKSISRKPFQKAAIEYAISIKDYKFIKENFTKIYVKSEYPELMEEIK